MRHGLTGRHLPLQRAPRAWFQLRGWGRFDVPPKPVIGQHVGKRFWLHECPDGEAPGLTPDIRAWAAKRGWPVPKRPRRMPMSPDQSRTPGDVAD